MKPIQLTLVKFRILPARYSANPFGKGSTFILSLTYLFNTQDKKERNQMFSFLRTGETWVLTDTPVPEIGTERRLVGPEDRRPQGGIIGSVGETLRERSFVGPPNEEYPNCEDSGSVRPKNQIPSPATPKVQGPSANVRVPSRLPGAEVGPWIHLTKEVNK